MKWSGKIGFVIESEDDTGIVIATPVERTYIGDFIRNYRRFDSGISVNEKVSLNNSLSIIADPFLNNNLQNIRYVKYIGTKWKIQSVEIQYPRIILMLGGEYTNG